MRAECRAGSGDVPLCISSQVLPNGLSLACFLFQGALRTGNFQHLVPGLGWPGLSLPGTCFRVTHPPVPSIQQDALPNTGARKG